MPKFVGRPVLNDAAVLQHDQPVEIHHRGEPVGDGQDGAVPARARMARCTSFDAWLSSALVASSSSSRGALQQGAGNPDPLTLTPGEPQAALPDDGVVACGSC